MRRSRLLPVLCAVVLDSTILTGAYAGLVAQWHFNEPPGSTVATDSVGGVNGLLVGDAAFVAGGISGNAVSMTRAGAGLVNMGDYFQFADTDFSIISWVRTNDQTPTTVLLAKHRSGIVEGYFIGINKGSDYYGAPDKAHFWQGQFSSTTLVSTSSVNDGSWHQVAVAYHVGGLAEIYVDGAPVEHSLNAQSIYANSVPFLLGGFENGGVPVNSFTGYVDEVRLYDNALTSEDVQYLYLYDLLSLIPGDASLDEQVDDDDASVLGAHWLQHGGAGWLDGDFNGDGNVNDADAAILAAHWGEGTIESDPVPEPGSVALLTGITVLTMIYLRRRKA
ncbi:MAG: LamG domain-containing protein [Planctomycetia bacterium]|nr:LamG domain-containing protein [Planctomycetia bacterium]